MAKTKLDLQDKQHQLLVAMFATFVDNFGYSPRDLYELIDHSKSQLFFTLQDMHIKNEKRRK